jgi:hypothetical protein
MLTVEEILKRLEDRNLRTVAARAGVSYPVVWRLSKFPEYGVNYETVKALSDYLERNK